MKLIERRNISNKLLKESSGKEEKKEKKTPTMLIHIKVYTLKTITRT